MELSDEIFRFVVEELTVRNSFDLACYQPRFVVDQVVSDCKYEGIAPTFTKEFVKKALGNLYAKSRSRTPVRPRVSKVVDNRSLKDRRSVIGLRRGLTPSESCLNFRTSIFSRGRWQLACRRPLFRVILSLLSASPNSPRRSAILLGSDEKP